MDGIAGDNSFQVSCVEDEAAVSDGGVALGNARTLIFRYDACERKGLRRDRTLCEDGKGWAWLKVGPLVGSALGCMAQLDGG